MNLPKNIKLSNAILSLCPNSVFSIVNNNYDSIVWEETNTEPKPSLEEVNSKLDELKLLLPMEKLREERDKKLFDTDYRIVADFPYPSEEVKQAWLTYRQELRDLPATATPQLDDNGFLTNVTWPTPPS
tara:strand:- start:4960 stop:5346 length:387 start_codon:yes stop_codon:yes gene_type:complete